MMIRKLAVICLLSSCATSTAVAQTGFGNAGNTQTQAGGAAGLTGAGQAGTRQAGTGLDGSTFGSGGLNAGVGGNATGNSQFGLGGLGGLGGFGRGGFGGGGFGGGGFGGGGFGGGGFGGQGQNQQGQTKIRATVTLGFSYQGPTTQTLTRRVNSTLARLPLPARFSGVNVTMNGRTAVLAGSSLESQDDVALLRQLLLLEPGVDKVETSRLLPNTAVEPVPAPMPSTR